MAGGGKLFHQEHLSADTSNPGQQFPRFHGRAGLPLTDRQVIASLLTTGTVGLVLSGLFAWSAHDLYHQRRAAEIKLEAAIKNRMMQEGEGSEGSLRGGHVPFSRLTHR